MEVFLQAMVNGILLGGFYSLMGMGQNMIFGVMNIVNFCHGEMLMVGMYITYVLYPYCGVDPYAALPIVAVLMFGLGALIQSTLITSSLKTKSFTNLLFLTVGLGLLLTNGALVIFDSTYYKIITPLCPDLHSSGRSREPPKNTQGPLYFRTAAPFIVLFCRKALPRGGKINSGFSWPDPGYTARGWR